MSNPLEKWRDNPLGLNEHKVRSFTEKVEDAFILKDVYKENVNNSRDIRVLIRSEATEQYRQDPRFADFKDEDRAEEVARYELWRAVLFDAASGLLKEDFISQII